MATEEQQGRRGSLDEGLNGHDDAQPETPEFAELDPTGRFGRFDQVLGRGAFKTVYKAFDNQEGMEVAWNQVRVSDLLPSKDGEAKDERERLMKEIKMLQSLKHKNIMTFYHYWWDPKTYAVNFITELFTSGTLRQYRKRHKSLKDEVLKRWAWQILCGLVYLHGHTPPIIHRDLKCDNIFINGSDGTVKIGDLGLATLLRSRTAPQSVLGTPEFMAPELYEEKYDAKVDVYSFGMCLLELATMEYPYSECKNAAQIYRKVSLGIRPKGLQEVFDKSPDLAELIAKCISPYEERPESRVLLKHDYFKTIREAKCLGGARVDPALLANASGGSFDMTASEYGSSTQSAAPSRTVSSIPESHAVGAGGGAGVAGSGSHAVLVSSVSKDSMHAALSHAASGAEVAQPSERPPSDAGSLRSQRSDVSDMHAAAAYAEAIEEGAEAGRQPHAPGVPAGPASDRWPGSAPVSKPTSPPEASPHGSPKVASPADSEGTRCEATNRCFLVVGKYQEERDKFNLRLRIREPGGYSRTVEFEFDLSRDTAVDVASEMVDDLQLSQEDAAVIACAIRAEVEQLSTRLHADVSLNLKDAAEALQQTLRENAASQAGETGGEVVSSLASLPCAALLARKVHGSAASLASIASAGSADRAGPAPGGPAAAAAAAAGLVSTGSVAVAASVAAAPGPQLSPSTFSAAAPSVPQPPRMLSPTPHPPLPPASMAAVAAAVAQPDLPPPSQRVVRSNSVDAAALLKGEPVSRSSSATHAREMVLQSPAHMSSAAGSGGMSPHTGILSPATSHSDRRIPLNKLFENLEDLAASRDGAGTPPLEFFRSATPPAGILGAAATAAVGSPSLVRQSSSGAVSDPGAPRALPAAPVGAPLTAPVSSPCLLPRAAAAAGGAPPNRAGSSGTSPRSLASFPLGSANLADVVARLDLQGGPAASAQHLGLAGLPPAPALLVPGAGALPPASRESSPGRESSASPTRGVALLNGGGSTGAVSDAAALLALNGKRPLAKDKEALRKQAADAMKAVEMRSLNLLEGGLTGTGKLARGTPMAASRGSIAAGACGVHGSAGNLTTLASNGPMAIPVAPVGAPATLPIHGASSSSSLGSSTATLLQGNGH